MFSLWKYILKVTGAFLHIHKVEVSLPVEAFDGNPTECEDYFLDVHFKLEGSKVNPTDIIIQIG